MNKKALFSFLVVGLVGLIILAKETGFRDCLSLTVSRILTQSEPSGGAAQPKAVIVRPESLPIKLPFIESIVLFRKGLPLFQRFFHFSDSLPLLGEEQYDWPLSTPEDQGFDSFIFDGAVEEAQRLGFFDSLLVVGNGHLIVEQYFNGSDRYEPRNVFSIAKSITSALTGVAIKEGHLQSLNERLVDFFPEYITAGMDPRKENITVGHLLTMRAGFHFNGTRQEWVSYLHSRDWMGYAIDLPLEFDPGEAFHYSTIETDLLAGILARATGGDTKKFAEDHLFSQLGISAWYWQMDSKGQYSGGHGMYFTPRDVARFAQLYLQDGQVNGRQLLPPGWVQQSITGSNKINFPWQTLINGNYGYSWWTGELGGYEVYCSIGVGGQTIINVPALNMAIVTTCRWEGEQSEGQETAVLKLVGDTILSPIGALRNPLLYSFSKAE